MNNFTPVIITTPIPMLTNKRCELDGFFPMFEEFKKEILNENTNLIWLDYSRNSYFSDNYSFFCDGAHLNFAGSKEFIRVLQEDLRKIGINQKL